MKGVSRGSGGEAWEAPRHPSDGRHGWRGGGARHQRVGGGGWAWEVGAALVTGLGEQRLEGGGGSGFWLTREEEDDDGDSGAWLGLGKNGRLSGVECVLMKRLTRWGGGRLL